MTSPDRAPDDNHGAPAWFWVDLPGLRQAFLDAGFAEHRRLDGDQRVVLMERTVDGETQETILPTLRYAGWSVMARTAVEALESFTGTSTTLLATMTPREAALRRLLLESRRASAAYR